MLRKTTPFLIACAVIALAACEKETPVDAHKPVEGWASVNDTELTEAQLDYALDRFFGNQFIDARAELKVRDSLIASRAIALKASEELDADTLMQVELAVQAYREERLIAAYIQSTTTPQPVSSQMVNDYYKTHQQEFGAATVARLAVLEASIEQAELPTGTISQQLYQISQAADWSQVDRPDYVKQYRASTNMQLPEAIRTGLQNVRVGETSGVIVTAERLYVFMKLSEEQIPPKPLAEVSAEIRKRLAATQLSKTVKALTEQIVGESDVIKNY